MPERLFDDARERLRKDGTVIDVSPTLSPIQDATGRISGTSTIARDISAQEQIEIEPAENLHYFESMDRVNRAMQQAKDLEEMLSDVLGEVLDIFDCDRVGLVYPCDPASQTWQIVMERSRPGFSTEPLRGPLPMTEIRADSMRGLLEASGPVQFSPEDDPGQERLQKFGIRSFMATAVHPRLGNAWEFGIHQCTHARTWNAQETKLFEEIARRLADGLNIMLANRDLRASEQRYRLVFENSPVSIWEEDFSAVKTLLDELKQQGMSDLDAWLVQHPETLAQCAQASKILDVNSAAIGLHGAPDKEGLLAGLLDTFTPESFDTFRRELVCLWNGGTQMAEDAVVKTLGGELRHVTIYFAVCPGYETTWGKVIVSLVDITERKQAEEAFRREQALLNRVMETSPVGIAVVNKVGQITFANPQAEKILGLSKEEITRRSYNAPEWHGTTLDGNPLPDEAQPFSRVMATRQPVFDVQHAIVWPDGRRVLLSINGAPLFDAQGEIEGVAFAMEDITERKLADERLRRNEHTLAEAQRIAHLGSWHMDLATNEVYWSEELYKMYGFDPALPPPLYTESMKLFTPKSWEKLSTSIARAVETGISYELELEMVPRTGGSRWMWARGELVRDDSGKPVEVRGVVMDITVRKLAELALLEQQTHSNSLLHLSRRLERAQTYAEILAAAGDEVRELIGYRNLWVYLLSDDLQYFTALIGTGAEGSLSTSEEGAPRLTIAGDQMLEQIAAAKEIVIIEDAQTSDIVNREMVRKLGNRTIVNIPIILFDRHLGTVGVGTFGEEGVRVPTASEQKYLLAMASHMAAALDRVYQLNERRRAEHAVQELNRDLEQRVTERTEQLEAANKELESFSYSVSHDLRSPLRAIDGFSKILLEDYTGKLDDEGRRMLGILRDNTNRMAQLIDDILKFSRAGRLELSFAPIDMADMAREVAAELLQTGTTGKLRLEVAPLPLGRGDRAMMRQVWVNLLSNAIKFSRTRETPLVQVGASVEEKEIVYFVKDNGVGFDMQYADKLFGVFQRLHTQEEFEGTGIGLAIVKRIIARHGGRVWVEGKVDVGATMYFALPRDPTGQGLEP